jgi:glycine betaine/proline transport system substrate-binding protein
MVVAATVMLAVSACGSSAPALVKAPGVTDKPCGTVTLAMNPWAGYAANAAVVSYVARTDLGCTVVTKAAAEEDSWKQLAKGQVDAILEDWGHDAEKKKYIDEQKVAVEAGLTGSKGVIGWYVPKWMEDTYPDIDQYQNLNKYASMFQTAKSGGKGQLLDGDPTYVTNDAALVKNLNLNFKVVYAGSEAAEITAFRQGEAQNKPVIGYFYTPQWFLSEVPLVKINLPKYTPGCDANPATVKCDYATTPLPKVASVKFMNSGSPAASLIKNFHWTNDDQNTVAKYIAADHMTQAQAAQKWVSANQAIVKTWVPAGTTLK